MPWLRLKLFLHKLANNLILALIYFGVITPFAILRRALGHSKFVAAPEGDSYWLPKEGEVSRESLKRQF